MHKAVLIFSLALLAMGLASAQTPGGDHPARLAVVAPKLTSGQRTQWNYLQGLLRKFGESDDRSTRETIARDYLSGSNGLKEILADNLEFWRGRAQMALIVDDSKAGREAATRFLQLAPSEQSTGGLRTRLQQRGWVQDGSQKSSLGGDFTLRALQLPMVYITEGSFVMGSTATTEADRGNEGPATQVTLTKPFWMAKYEISQYHWRTVMGTYPSDTEQGSLPKVGITWTEAMEFCARLTNFERAAGRLPPGYEYSLPTEAQWAYVCRAGTTEDSPGNLDQLAWYEGNSGGRLHPIGEKLPNPWGVCNMQGNASEWCRDYYAERLPGGNQTDPVGPPEGDKRVVRGGNFASTAASCRVTKRGGALPDEPGTLSDKIGFRVALCWAGKP